MNLEEVKCFHLDMGVETHDAPLLEPEHKNNNIHHWLMQNINFSYLQVT